MRIARSIAAAGLALVAACSAPSNMKEAQAKIAAFHQHIDKGTYEAVWRDCAEEITKSERKEEFLGLLASIHDHMGKVKESRQTGWKVNYDNGVSTTALTMQTTFEKGALQENFLFRSTEQGLKLAGYSYEEKK